MKEDSAYSHARGDINHLPCVFAVALQERHAVCELAVRAPARPRGGIACAQPLARAACAQMMALLREKSAFTLGTGAARQTLTGPQRARLQCGGLEGLKTVVDAEAVAPDVHRLVRLAQERHGALAELPFAEIVKGVAAWKKPRPAKGRS